MDLDAEERRIRKDRAESNMESGQERDGSQNLPPKLFFSFLTIFFYFL